MELLLALAVFGFGGLVIGGLADEEIYNETKAQSDSSARIAASDQAVLDAQFEANRQEAEIAAKGLERQAAEITRQATVQNSLAIKQIQGAYGTEGEMGSVWAQYSNKLLEDVGAKGKFEAAAGMSGLKKSGSIEQMGGIQSAAITESERIAKQEITTQQQGAVGQIGENWKESSFRAQEALSAASEKRNAFAKGGSAFNMYQANKAALTTSQTETADAYTRKLKKEDPWAWQNWTGNVIEGISYGFKFLTGAGGM